eukprot:COSAG01_NODE_26495_length_712_cov_1.145188_1_plen_23_part_10
MLVCPTHEVCVRRCRSVMGTVVG